MGALWSTTTGITVTPELSLQQSTVLACVRVIAETLAMLPIHIYERLPNGGKRRAPDMPLYPVIHDLANPEMTSNEFFETLIGHVALRGNGYAEIQTNRGGDVMALWPLRPDRTAPRRNKDTQRIEYVIQMPTGAPVVLPGENVLHVRGFGTTGLIGLNPVQLARQAIGLGLATEQFGASFFGNGASPSIVLKHPGEMSPLAYERLQKSWREQHEGLSNAQRTAILEEGVTLEKVGVDPDDAQFLETRKYQVRDIARFWRVPPHMVGDLEQATFSNIEEQGINFKTYTLLPWLVRVEKAIYRCLLTPTERQRYFAEVLSDALERGDITKRYNAYNTGHNGGWLSQNDIRDKENMNPIDGGDVYLQPLNMAPTGQGGSDASQTN
jgi:HK97 family phage portal protein